MRARAGAGAGAGTGTEEAHPTIAGFKRASSEGGRSALAGLEEKARRLAGAVGSGTGAVGSGTGAMGSGTGAMGSGMETQELSALKREVAKDPSVLEKVGRDPQVVEKNLAGVTSERVFP